MLIRNQNRKSLIVLQNIEQIYVFLGEVRADFSDGRPEGYITIGQYSTEEKAIKVLDMIQEKYFYHYYGQGGAMATANFYVPPFGFNPPKVFQMPQDSEVEECV